MSTTTEAAAASELHKIVTALIANNVVKYLSAAGLVILLYDHILLLGDEINLIWPARWSWPKSLFMINRYTVPAFIIVSAYQLSGLSILSPLFCKNWLTLFGFFNIATLAMANLFVIQRVHVLWDYNKRILSMLLIALTFVYLCVIGVGIYAFLQLRNDITYSKAIKICTIGQRPTINIVTYAVPVSFDVFLFSLTCWNALSRPRHMHTTVVKQLYLDGALYFLMTLALRLFNIVVLAVVDVSYVLLGVYFLWAMVTVVINRMLITIRGSI